MKSVVSKSTTLTPIPFLLDEDPISICKPKSIDAPVYRQVRQMINETLDIANQHESIISEPDTRLTETPTDAVGPNFRYDYETRVTRWSGETFALDQRFVNTTLLRDQGEEAQGLRWQTQTSRQ